MGMVVVHNTLQTKALGTIKTGESGPDTFSPSEIEALTLLQCNTIQQVAMIKHALDGEILGSPMLA